MKLSLLPDRLGIEKELKIEERSSEGVQQYIVWTTIPFPKKHAEWYVFTLPLGVNKEDFEIEQWQIDAMLRHLWMFQLDIGDEGADAMTEIEELSASQEDHDPSDEL